MTLWEHEGMLVVYGRVMEGLRQYLGVIFLLVLMSHTRVAVLIMLNAHSMDH